MAGLWMLERSDPPRLAHSLDTNVLNGDGLSNKQKRRRRRTSDSVCVCLHTSKAKAKHKRMKNAMMNESSVQVKVDSPTSRLTDWLTLNGIVAAGTTACHDLWANLSGWLSDHVWPRVVTSRSQKGPFEILASSIRQALFGPKHTNFKHCVYNCTHRMFAPKPIAMEHMRETNLNQLDRLVRVPIGHCRRQ